jgi:hypothetical protein
MALLDIQAIEPAHDSKDTHGGRFDSCLSVLACGCDSALSLLLC